MLSLPLQKIVFSYSYENIVKLSWFYFKYLHAAIKNNSRRKETREFFYMSIKFVELCTMMSYDANMIHSDKNINFVRLKIVHSVPVLCRGDNNKLNFLHRLFL